VTRTEDRLVDALNAAAEYRVQPGTLRPLTVPEAPGREQRCERRRQRNRRRLRRFAPAGAAAGVALAVGAAFLLSSLSWTGTAARHGHPGRGGALFPAWAPSAVRPAANPPSFYAVDESTTVIHIRDRATGKVTGTVPAPIVNHFPLQPEGVVSGPGGAFIAAFDEGALGPESGRETRLFSFRISPAGRVVGLSLVKGGILDGLTVSGYTDAAAMAISPGGSRVAVAAYSTYGVSTGKGSTPEVPRIVVINLRTGARDTWRNGLQGPQYGLSISSVSWAPGGRWLVFLASWCGAQSEGGFCGGGSQVAQVRTLNVAGRGGTLSQGSVLLGDSASYPFIVQALLTPGGRSVTVAVLPGAGPTFGSSSRMELRIVQVPLTGTGRPVLLYHASLGNRAGVAISSDPSGRYWLVSGRSNGWIHDGKLRPLPPQHGYAVADAW
jgi:hypothetical protein